MLTQMIQTFAPDGLSGGHAPVQGRFEGSQRDHAPKSNRDSENHENNHHDYDDGLVHSHSWASSSYSR